MTTPLDDRYLEWLYSQVEVVEETNTERTHWELLRQMYSTEFVWFVPNDDNRMEDGRELRFEFLDASGAQNVDPIWVDMGCSVLELMIGLARRLVYKTEGRDAEAWFWELVDNLGLTSCNDAAYRRRSTKRMVEEALDRMIWRQYGRDGSGGGLFPLQHPEHDQRRVEIWYQMSAYLLEKGWRGG